MHPLCVFFAVLAVSLLPAFGQAPAPEQAKPPAPQASPAAEKPGDHVVLSVGSEKVTAAELEALIEALPAQLRTVARGSGRRMFAEQLANMKSLAQEARRQKLDQKPEFKKMLAFQEENLLAGNLFQSLNETITVDEAATKKYYDEHKGEYESAQASHILVRMQGSPVPLREGQKELSETEALEKTKELKKRIAAGEDFAVVAKAESDDATSGANGGNLGTVRRGQTVPPFENAVFTMTVKELSDPVKTQFGYHLIRVDKRDAAALDTVREDIQKKIRPEMARKKMEDIRKQTQVTIDDSYFGPPAPPQAGPIPPPAAAK
jgi:peptidyl-prolyl cis-trans isomerase C